MNVGEHLDRSLPVTPVQVDEAKLGSKLLLVWEHKTTFLLAFL